MQTRMKLISGLLILIFVLVACSQAPGATDTTSMDEPTEAMSETMDKDTAEMGMSTDSSEAMSKPESQHDNEMDAAMAVQSTEPVMNEPMDDMKSTEEMPMEEGSMEKSDDTMKSEPEMGDHPTYFNVELTNVNSGDLFKISDFSGKVVLVETMAQWCSNCLKQQLQVLDLHEMLGEREDFISIGLDIDPHEDAESLKSYVRMNGFRWIYAVSPAEVSREIANLYGDQYLNPPATPMFIIAKDGTVHELPFGIKSAEKLLEALQPFLDAEM